MPWFKVDDGLAFHHKVMAAGNPAMGLWVRAGAFCAAQLTNGFVPDHVLATLGTKSQAARLCTVGLWSSTEGGHVFHGWEEFQPTKEQVESERETTRKRVQKWRDEKRSNAVTPTVSNAVSNGVTNAVGNGTCTPAPARPDPTHKQTPMETSPETLPLVEPPDPDVDEEHDDPEPSPTAADAQFDGFWKAYPRKVGKGQARTAFKTACKKVPVTTIAKALTEYLAAIEGRSPDMIRHPATWLNGEPWEDNPDHINPPPTLTDYRQQTTNDMFARATARAIAADQERKAI